MESRADKDCTMTEQDAVMSSADKNCTMTEQEAVMSKADKDCAMTEQDAVAADELKRFCQQLVHIAQFKPAINFITGSTVEIASSGSTMKELGVKDAMNDIDYMFYLSDLYAFPLTQRVPVKYNGIVLRVYTHGLHPGYARLIYERSGKKLNYFHGRSCLGRYHEICGPAQRCRELDAMKENLESVPDDKKLSLEGIIPVLDFVPAVHSPYWPVEAYEWITRTRRHACPSKSVIKQVVRYGCDFVGVAHKLSCSWENKNEWRFSFSMAELLIIRSWTNSQRIAYRVLRLSSKMIAQKAAERNNKTVLCTYYFKTLMLWACEERPEEFWAEHSLVSSVLELLFEMSEWLKLKFCCNYFIRGNNMMDHLADKDVSRDVAYLFEVSASHNLVSDMVTLCAADELFENSLIFRSDLPIWIMRTLVIYNRIQSEHNDYQDTGSIDFSLQLQSALVEELTDVYRGLAFHREAVIRDSASDQYLRLAERHFTAATRLHQCTERAIVDITATTSDLIHDLFSEYDADYNISSTRSAESEAVQCALHCEYKATLLSKSANLKCVLYTRVIVPQSNDRQKVKSHTMSIVLYFLNEPQGFQHVTPVRFYRQRPDRSPTVNVSWFIAKAYLANLYYMQQQYKAALETCNEVLEVYKHSTGNKKFAEYAFSVLISTQWTAVYDAELQAMLGLCSLCAFVSNRTDARSVCLAVCPVLFVLYLKARCVFDQPHTTNDAQRSFAEYDEHINSRTFFVIGHFFGKHMLAWAMNLVHSKRQLDIILTTMV